MVLKHGPLTSTAVPGFTPALPQGMGAVVSGGVFKWGEVSALAAADQVFRVVVCRGFGFVGHLSLQKIF